MTRCRVSTVAAVIVSLVWIAYLGTALGTNLASADAAANPVGLADARSAPQTILYVIPGGQYDTLDGVSQCARGGFWTEFSAYRWDGSALGGQRWNAMHDRAYWHDARGGRVTFDGRTIYNGTRHPILFAGWCS